MTYTVIEDLKLALVKNTISRVAADRLETAGTLAPKTVNNCFVVLRMLVVARKRGLIECLSRSIGISVDRSGSAT